MALQIQSFPFTIKRPKRDDYIDVGKDYSDELKEYWRMGYFDMKPKCHYCTGELDEVYGDRIWPNREDLARKKFQICWSCSAWVGLKDDGTPNGYPAKEHIRELRQMILNAWEAICSTGKMSWGKARDFRSWLRNEKDYDISDLGMLEEEQLRELLLILDRMVIPDTPEIDALFK